MSPEELQQQLQQLAVRVFQLSETSQQSFEQVHQLSDRVRQLEKQLSIEKSDRYVFQKDLQMFDGRKVLFGGNKGTQIGTTATQKLAFYGLTPKVQPTADTINAATNVYSTGYFADSSYNNNEMNMLNFIYQALIGLGIIREI